MKTVKANTHAQLIKYFCYKIDRLVSGYSTTFCHLRVGSPIMRYLILTIFAVLFVASAHAQEDTTRSLEPAADTPVFLDGVSVDKSSIEAYDPTEIAFITVVKNNEANGVSEENKDAIYVYTKKYAREQYWNYLKSKSPRYGQVVPLPGAERDVVYILNGAVIEENVESVLFDINDSNFINLLVVDEKELKKHFKIKDKKWGVLLKVK
jgi:hypothetical protein